MALNITSGKISRAQKIVIYGPEGIGKSTLASQFPDPVFIDVETGTSQLDVKRTQTPRSFDELVEICGEVAATPGICRTLVLDTADAAEVLCIEQVCRKAGKSGVEDFGYGKGYTYVGESYAKFLAVLDKVIDAGINVVVLAHAKMRKFEEPDETGAYDRWELKLSKQTAPLVKEWADALLFCTYKTLVITAENGSRKAQGGQRIIRTSHAPTYDAKNRHGLAEELPMEYRAIASIISSAPPVPAPVPEPKPAPPAAPSALDELKARMLEDHVLDEELQEVVASKGYFPKDTAIDAYPADFISKWVLPNWSKITEIIADNNLPF